METYNIKEMLRKGTSEEDLLAALQSQINSAKEEIQKEEEAAAKKAEAAKTLDDSRYNLVVALYKYLYAKGDLNKEPSEKEIQETVKMVKDLDERGFGSLHLFDLI